jgi:hypothetical protein
MFLEENEQGEAICGKLQLQGHPGMICNIRSVLRNGAKLCMGTTSCACTTQAIFPMKAT